MADELTALFRFTSVTAKATQSTSENSLGGYMSTNNIYTTTTSTDRISKTASVVPVLNLPTATSGMVEVDLEVMNYTGIDTTNLQLINAERGIVPQSGFPHGVTPEAAQVRYLSIDSLFNPKFDNSYEQYRCVAVYNNDLDVEDVKIVLIQNASSNVRIDVGIEVPLHDFHIGTLTDVLSTVMIRDSGLVGLFVDNYFSRSVLNITSGAGVGGYSTISSYDSATGTFVLDNAIASMVAGNSYSIEPTPSQRTINQLTAPVSNDDYFFGFLGDGGSNELGYQNIRENGDVFRENDVFYIWIKRSFTRNVKSGSNTGSVILLNYLLSET